MRADTTLILRHNACVIMRAYGGWGFSRRWLRRVTLTPLDFLLHRDRFVDCDLLHLRVVVQHEDCDHAFLVGSANRSVPLIYDTGLRAHQSRSHMLPFDTLRSAPENGDFRATDGGISAKEVSVYLDEELVGVGKDGNFSLTGLVPGMHTLRIVALDAAGAELEVPYCLLVSCHTWRGCLCHTAAPLICCSGAASLSPRHPHR